MSRYLAMLKGQKTEKRPLGEPPKPPKPGFDGFGGTPDAHFQDNEGGFGGFVGTPDTQIQQKTPGLLEVIKRMADYYQYEPDELTHALDDARQHPDRWRELIRNDRNAALFVNPLPEHQLEVVHMLRADSALRYAFTTRIEDDDVIVTLAVRDVAVCDLTIPASHYDPLTFWKTIQEVTDHD